MTSPRPAGPADSSPNRFAARAVDRLIREDEGWVSAVVPSGTGVLIAVRR